jgi:hypothetical protein
MAISQTSSWNLLALQRKSVNVVRARQRVKQSVGKQSTWYLLSYSTLYKLLSSHSPSMDTTSDADGPESEEDDIEENPYPLEGKYIDEYDRQRCTATFAHCLPSPIDKLTGYWKCLK